MISVILSAIKIENISPIFWNLAEINALIKSVCNNSKYELLIQIDKRHSTEAMEEQYGQEDVEKIKEYKIIATKFFNQKKFESARKIYQKIYEMAPRDSENLLGLGRTFSEERNYEKVREVMHKLIAIDPNHRKAHDLSGSAYRHVGMFREAEQVYRILTTKYLTDSKAHYLLAISLYKQNKIQEAVKSYEDAFRENHENVNILINWGKAISS